jgi:hypothetical protein
MIGVNLIIISIIEFNDGVGGSFTFLVTTKACKQSPLIINNGDSKILVHDFIILLMHGTGSLFF